MKVVVSLRQLQTYADRFKVFLELSNHVDQLFLLTDVVDDWVREMMLNYPRAELVTLDVDRYSQEATAWIENQVVSATDEYIVHSTFGHLVPFFERYGVQRDRRFRLVHSQYTANHDWFDWVRHQDYPMSFKYLGQRVKSYWTDRRMAINTDGLLVMCPGHRERVSAAHGVPVQKIYALSSEVNSNFYGDTSPARVTPRRMIFVGACYKNKGLDIIFEALPRLFHLLPDLEVELYGNAVKRQKDWFINALERVRKYGRVTMFDRVGKDTLKDAFQAADLIVSASRFEGSPRAIREALAAGCPALLSEIPGHLGLDPNRRFISYVNTEDAMVWAEAMHDCLSRTDEEWMTAARGGMTRMSLRHSPDAVARELVGIYENLF
ncbi:MAG: glycosyltransferase family 4 protein [Bradymonadia bacterium]